jgi:hypothetical protein
LATYSITSWVRRHQPRWHIEPKPLCAVFEVDDYFAPMLTADLSYRCGQHELGNPRLLHAFPGLVEGYARSSGRVICIVRKGRFRDVPRTLTELDEEPTILGPRPTSQHLLEQRQVFEAVHVAGPCFVFVGIPREGNYERNTAKSMPRSILTVILSCSRDRRGSSASRSF